MEETYFLILEKKDRPGDFLPINLSLLDSNVINQDNCEVIDSFTSKFTKSELMELIKVSNIVTPLYLTGNLYIIKQGSKQKYPVIYKDSLLDFNLIEFIYFNIDNKQYMNKIFNKYDVLVKDETKSLEFKEQMEVKSVSNILLLINTIPYIKRRMLNLYIYQNILINDKIKKLEKNA